MSDTDLRVARNAAYTHYDTLDNLYNSYKISQYQGKDYGNLIDVLKNSAKTCQIGQSEAFKLYI